MNKRFVKHLTVLFFVVIVSLMAAYVGLAFYYRNAFEYATWINGVYCTGRSVEDVNRELADSFQYEGITVYDKDGNSYHISAQEIGYQFDFVRALEIYQKQQNAWAWIDSLVHENVAEISPVVSYDLKALGECVDGLPFMDEGKKEEYRFEIVKTDQGYELINERMNVLNGEEAVAAIQEALDHSAKTVSLEEAGCYHNLELTEEMQKTLTLWEKLDAFQQCGITYQMGEDRIPVDKSVVCDWILLAEDGSFAIDENGQLQLKEGAIEGFVEALAREYDTVGTAREFTSTSGETITVEGGIYGNKLDQKKEVEYLTEAFYAKKREIHEPEYTQKAFAQGKNDIGDTYIEIDMGEQMMYYYADGVCTLETPVVTGNTSRKRGTPTGVNYVYNKQTNRILRGEDYASHVDFWMPVKGNIGIHDASWRSSYGGTIYQTNGSHGCINTPRDAMVKLYEAVEIGTPVVMFY